jgi:hypothetical protein
MKRALLYSIAATMALGSATTADAKHYRGREHWEHGDRTRTIYVVENRRPVRRVVYVDDSGRYYHHVHGHRVYVHGRVFTSYPSRYFYSDGRPRVGVAINF